MMSITLSELLGVLLSVGLQADAVMRKIDARMALHFMGVRVGVAGSY
jgi:hypothetical protein